MNQSVSDPTVWTIFKADFDGDYASTGQPVARGTWNAATDAASQAKWQISVGNALRETSIIEACNSLLSPPTWGAAELIAAQNPTALSYVNDFSHHNYPGGTVQSLMSHSNVASNIATFRFDVAAALNIGKQYVFGETNSGMFSVISNFPFKNKKESQF